MIPYYYILTLSQSVKCGEKIGPADCHCIKQSSWSEHALWIGHGSGISGKVVKYMEYMARWLDREMTESARVNDILVICTECYLTMLYAEPWFKPPCIS